MDESSSMDSQNLVQPVIDSIANHSDSLNQDTDVYLQFFSGRASELTTWEGFSKAQRRDFLNTVDKEFKPNGSTRLFDTVAEAITRIRAVANQYNQISFIIFSDADDTSSSVASRDKRWSSITPELLELVNANAFVRTYLIALPGQKPTAEDFAEFEKNGILHTAVPQNAPVVIPVMSPVVEFSAVPTQAEPGEEIQFTVKSIGGPVDQYVWDFGDGNTSESIGSIEYSYSKEGEFDVSVRAVGTGGAYIATQADYIQIAYDVPLNSDFTVSPDYPVSGDKVLFSSQSTSALEQLVWYINENRVGTGNTFEWKAAEAGSHKVELKVQEAERSNSTVKTVVVAAPPLNAEFKFPLGKEYIFGSTVRAVALANGADLQHFWTINGDEKMSGAIIEWKSDREGTIEFVHRVEDALGRFSESTSKVLVSKPVIVLPGADFRVEPSRAIKGETLKLSAVSGDSELQHEWYVNDRMIGNGLVIRYTPKESGKLTLRHVIRIGDASKSNSVDIHVEEPELVEAVFKASTTKGMLPLEVDFQDESVGDIVAYTWDFGDGSSSYQANPSHIYTTPGEYYVSLTVTDKGGVSTISSETVRIVVEDSAVGWIKWAVIGVIAAIILFILFLSKKPSPSS